MYKQNQLQQPFFNPSLGKRALIGAVIALALISAFLLNAGTPDPAWPKYWYLQPLLVLPVAGATGGVCYHVLHYLSREGGWKRVAANIFSMLLYIFGLWMGTVLGLNGTMWN